MPTATVNATDLFGEVNPESVLSRSRAFQAAGVPAPLAESLAKDAATNQFLRDKQLRIQAEVTRQEVTPTAVGLKLVSVEAPESNPPESVEIPLPVYQTDYRAGFALARGGSPLPTDATEAFRAGFADFGL